MHIQPGSYSINATLVVPAGSDLQIIGDGYYSQLAWSGARTGPVMRLLGPSKATLRDFSVNGNRNSADGIEVDNADQPGSRVFMEQSNLSLSHTNLFVDGLDYTNVELHDFYHYYDFNNRYDERRRDGGTVCRARSLAGRRDEHLRRRLGWKLH